MLNHAKSMLKFKVVWTFEHRLVSSHRGDITLGIRQEAREELERTRCHAEAGTSLASAQSSASNFLWAELGAAKSYVYEYESNIALNLSYEYL